MKLASMMLLAACGVKAQPHSQTRSQIANAIAPPDASVLDAELDPVSGYPINRILVRVIAQLGVRPSPDTARVFLRVDWPGGSSEQFDAKRYNGEFADFNVVVPQGGDATLTATYDQDGTLSTKQSGDMVGAIQITIPTKGLELRVDTPR